LRLSDAGLLVFDGGRLIVVASDRPRNQEYSWFDTVRAGRLPWACRAPMIDIIMFWILVAVAVWAIFQGSRDFWHWLRRPPHQRGRHAGRKGLGIAVDGSWFYGDHSGGGDGGGGDGGGGH
jgi:uncharacterized membrane protein YgcG